MKIAFFIDGFPAPSTTFIMNQMRGMIDRGHAVDIYAKYRTAGSLSGAERNQDEIQSRCRFIFETPGGRLSRVILLAVRVFRSGLWLRPGVVLAALNVFKYGRAAASLRMLNAVLAVYDKTYDIIHCQFGTLGPLVLELKKIGALKGPLVTSFRGYDATQYLQSHPDAYADLFVLGDLFLPVSASLKQCIIAQGCPSERIRILHSGIDCECFSYTGRHLKAGGRVHVVSIGRLTEKKGLEYAIRAIAPLAGRLDCPLVYSIAGDGELRERLEHLIQDLAVGAYVHLLGWQSPVEIASLLDRAHILVAPSVTAANGDQEGIPNVLKEAMAKGLPVLATNHSGIPELVEDGVSGYLVPERDPDALRERLRLLIENPGQWAAMGEAGRRRVLRDYDNKRINDELEQIYEGVRARILSAPVKTHPRPVIERTAES